MEDRSEHRTTSRTVLVVHVAKRPRIQKFIIALSFPSNISFTGDFGDHCWWIPLVLVQGLSLDLLASQARVIFIDLCAFCTTDWWVLVHLG